MVMLSVGNMTKQNKCLLIQHFSEINIGAGPLLWICRFESLGHVFYNVAWPQLVSSPVNDLESLSC